MNYKEANNLSRRKFKRRFGVSKLIFERMQLGIKQEICSPEKRGCPWKLDLEEQILVTLEY